MVIKKEGDRWCLYTSNGKKKIGCHDSKEKALAQERAIRQSKKELDALMARLEAT